MQPCCDSASKYVIKCKLVANVLYSLNVNVILLKTVSTFFICFIQNVMTIFLEIDKVSTKVELKEDLSSM